MQAKLEEIYDSEVHSGLKMAPFETFFLKKTLVLAIEANSAECEASLTYLSF